jgi:hypothetical protein
VQLTLQADDADAKIITSGNLPWPTRKWVSSRKFVKYPPLSACDGGTAIGRKRDNEVPPELAEMLRDAPVISCVDAVEQLIFWTIKSLSAGSCEKLTRQALLLGQDGLLTVSS